MKNFNPIIKWTAVVVLIGLTLMGCRKKLVPATDDFAEYGWTVVENGDYTDALTQFEDALLLDPTNSDAYNGLGWIFSKMNEPDSAINYFTLGLGYATPGSQIQLEIYTGRAFSYHAKSQFLTSIDDCNEVLGTDSNFVFTRDITVTANSVATVLAAGYFGVGDYTNALLAVQVVDATFQVDVNTDTGVAQLAAKIEALTTG